MKVRRGVTLMEVLVSIFVSGIGLLSLLALFPLGALSMAQAIKDSRTTVAARNAFAAAEAKQLRSDPALNGGLGGVNPFLDHVALLGSLPDLTTFMYPNGTPYAGPSYPLFVDPVGANLATSIGNLGNLAIQRGVPSFIQTNQDIAQWFFLRDDITFLDNGTSDLSTGFIQQQGRYSWSYMLQRPDFSNAGVVNMAVVVYSGRSSPAFTLGETAYTCDWVQGANSVLVPYNPNAGQERPAVKVGNWVLDATVLNNAGQVAIPDPHGTFYRVVNVTDTTWAGQPAVILEFQTNIKRSSGGSMANTNSQGVLVVMDNVVEVFEKGPGWQP
jgi:prepilin-type N-terminal cleavage/methylation domain-containing protein